MLRLMRPVTPRMPVSSATIARLRLQRAIAADHHPLAPHQAPAEDLLSRLLGESPTDEGRAA
jgi:hypothetical protein